jgi:Uma2 family endonuclease
MLTVEEIAPERPRPLARAEYDRLVAMGAFENERIELLSGVLVEMRPQNPAHAYPIQQLVEVLVRALKGRAKVRGQLPLALADDSEPEPDIAVVPLGDYSKQHPQTASLVVEVADSSLNKDRGVKRRLYASAGIPEYWLINLIEGVVERRTKPGNASYGQEERLERNARVVLVSFPDIEIALADLLPAV